MSSPHVTAPRTSSHSPALQAVFWDMDGTIVDTEPYWIQAEKDLVRSYGGSWSTEEAESLVGQALTYSAGRLREAGVPLEIRDIIDHLITRVAEQVRARAPWRPGARELLAELVAEGIPCALVTMSEPVLADEIIAQLPAGTFEFTVTGDAVTNGKPDPEPYNLAFETLAGRLPDLDRARVLAIEDSLPGATSAQAAGLVTLAVPNVVPLPADAGRHQWESLKGRSLADLDSLVRLPAAEVVR